jgi:protein-tyrosine-phosphatase
MLFYDRGVAASVEAGRPTSEPPPFVRLAAHPVRWHLLRQLVASDRTVTELVGLLGESQNLVSYHLRLLREGGLVFARRSSADRRDSYYAIDLIKCGEALQSAGASLHPALDIATVPRTPSSGRRSRQRPQRVLFLCTGNSARSQIAEALLDRMSGGTVHAASAGSAPKRLHPNAVRVMARRGIDISAHRSKHLDEFGSQPFDAVITLCDRVREVCPEYPSHTARVHWSVPDPSLEGSTARASYPAFERTASELETRIGFQLPLLTETHT